MKFLCILLGALGVGLLVGCCFDNVVMATIAVACVVLLVVWVMSMFKILDFDRKLRDEWKNRK